VNAAQQITSGSVLWQTVFVSFAVVLILFEVARGWHSGLPRQLVRIAAVVLAYAVAFFGGRMLVPVVRPMVRVPDFVISTVGGALLALIVYALISGIGRMLFKRTGQQSSATVRLLYGLSGGALGVLFGGFVVWLLVVGIRALGTIADAEVQSEASRGAFLNSERTVRGSYARPQVEAGANGESPSLVISLARLKNSIEMGSLGTAVKTVDAVPTSTYQTLGKVGQVFSNPISAQRFLNFPGARELTEHPRIVALRNDDELMQKIAQGRLLDLLQDQRLIDAANDPSLAAQVKKFQLQRALDYATGNNAAAR
jgi:hypothetical protein